MKKCPYCLELIQDSAKKCRYCGERLNKKNDVVFKKTVSMENKLKQLKKEKKATSPLKKAEYNIKVALVCSIIAIIFSIIMFFVGIDRLDSIYLFIGIFYFIVLAFGIYKKSRVATIAAFTYSLLSAIFQLSGGEYVGIVSIMLIIGYFKGIQGTIDYHKLKKTTRLSIWEVVLLTISVITMLFLLIGFFLGQ